MQCLHGPPCGTAAAWLVYRWQRQFIHVWKIFSHHAVCYKMSNTTVNIQNHHNNYSPTEVNNYITPLLLSTPFLRYSEYLTSTACCMSCIKLYTNTREGPSRTLPTVNTYIGRNARSRTRVDALRPIRLWLVDGHSHRSCRARRGVDIRVRRRDPTVRVVKHTRRNAGKPKGNVSTCRRSAR